MLKVDRIVCNIQLLCALYSSVLPLTPLLHLKGDTSHPVCKVGGKPAVTAVSTCAMACDS